LTLSTLISLLPSDSVVLVQLGAFLSYHYDAWKTKKTKGVLPRSNEAYEEPRPSVADSASSWMPPSPGAVSVPGTRSHYFETDTQGEGDRLESNEIQQNDVPERLFEAQLAPDEALAAAQLAERVQALEARLLQSAKHHDRPHVFAEAVVMAASSSGEDIAVIEEGSQPKDSGDPSMTPHSATSDKGIFNVLRSLSNRTWVMILMVVFICAAGTVVGGVLSGHHKAKAGANITASAIVTTETPIPSTMVTSRTHPPTAVPTPTPPLLANKLTYI
jgi:hypothetical protein